MSPGARRGGTRRAGRGTSAAARLRRRRRGRVLATVVRVAVVVLVVGAIGSLTWLVGFSAVLGVREVRVTGTDVVDAEQVREVAAVAPDTPLARLDADGIERRVAGLAPVASVEVHREWPNTVVVAVTERTPVFAVRDTDDDRLMLVDGSGVPYLRVAEAARGTIVAEGVGQDVLAEIATAISGLPPELREQVSSVRADTRDSIEFGLGEDRTLVWGDAGQGETKAAVALVLLRQSGSRYDVSAPDRPAVR